MPRPTPSAPPTAWQTGDNDPAGLWRQKAPHVISTVTGNITTRASRPWLQPSSSVVNARRGVTNVQQQAYSRRYRLLVQLF